MFLGGDVRGVFDRLARGIKAVGDSVKAESGKKFVLDSKYGYLQLCPTNLGAGMRASVHMDLPGWTKITYDMVQEMIRKYWGDAENEMKMFLDYVRDNRSVVQGMLRQSPGVVTVGSGSGGGPGKF